MNQNHHEANAILECQIILVGKKVCQLGIDQYQTQLSEIAQKLSNWIDTFIDWPN